ncbi:MAG TPA: hypothetical protein VHB51_02340 [Candidatus Saccharimonadales bacterium]|nr:hypothetical protein [Candidatus Saccharimonadales bacterium]
MSKVLPVFQEASFEFGDLKVPPHVEAYPIVPNYIGLYSVFGAVDGVRPYPLAVDVRSEKLARKLADARARQQEATIYLYGYSDDVIIYHPAGDTERTYIGRSE